MVRSFPSEWCWCRRCAFLSLQREQLLLARMELMPLLFTISVALTMLYEAAELCEATAVSYQEEEANRSMPVMKMNTNGAGDKE